MCKLGEKVRYKVLNWWSLYIGGFNIDNKEED